MATRFNPAVDLILMSHVFVYFIIVLLWRKLVLIHLLNFTKTIMPD